MFHRLESEFILSSQLYAIGKYLNLHYYPQVISNPLQIKRSGKYLNLHYYHQVISIGNQEESFIQLITIVCSTIHEQSEFDGLY